MTKSKTILDRGRKSAKETSRKVHEEMEGGNEVSEANGITQFANGEPKRWMCI